MALAGLQEVDAAKVTSFVATAAALEFPFGSLYKDATLVVSETAVNYILPLSRRLQ